MRELRIWAVQQVRRVRQPAPPPLAVDTPTTLAARPMVSSSSRKKYGSRSSKKRIQRTEQHVRGRGPPTTPPLAAKHCLTPAARA